MFYYSKPGLWVGGLAAYSPRTCLLRYRKVSSMPEALSFLACSVVTKADGKHVTCLMIAKEPQCYWVRLLEGHSHSPGAPPHSLPFPQVSTVNYHSSSQMLAIETLASKTLNLNRNTYLTVRRDPKRNPWLWPVGHIEIQQLFWITDS